MSRAVTPPTSQPANPQQGNLQQGNLARVPHDKIAMRAYEKWIKRGRPVGNPETDWTEAEAELKAELNRGQPQQPNQQRR